MEQPERPYFHRDLSWLSFNYRVLMEAKDPTVPLYERIKFLAIFSSNLDEFFRVRVAALRSLVNVEKKKIKKGLGFTPSEVLPLIQAEVLRHQQEFGLIFRDEIIPKLEENNIILHRDEVTTDTHKQFIVKYFRRKVLAYLQPVLLKEGVQPFLNNRQLYFLVALSRPELDDSESFAILNIPSDHLPRFIQLPTIDGKHYYMFLDDVVRENLPRVFPGYQLNGCYSIKINRDADLNLDDEFSGDLIDKIQKQLDKRNIGVPSRLLYDLNMPKKAIKFLRKTLDLSKEDMVEGGRYHNLNDLFGFPNPLAPSLENNALTPLFHPLLDESPSFFEALDQKDIMLHFPYQSYDYVLQFFNEAAIDPFVEEIFVTVYRIAANSFIANALISAARNGKKVTCFVEVKARFDEANNLKWATEMSNAGVKIIYSIPGLKVHAKVALVVRRKDDIETGYAFLGTGNFNESTAKIYADHGLFTTDKELTDDLKKVFQFLSSMKEKPTIDHLLVAQINLKEQMAAFIDQEIANAKEGKQAGIQIKLNNLEDKVLINKLYEASEAGVPINLIVRGICCLIPRIDGISDNITITRIVDRYLEHARVFIFHNDGNPRVYMGSADWMKRNLYHRVEVVFPIRDPEIREAVFKLMSTQLQDNTKAVHINEKQENVMAASAAPEKAQAQLDFYHWLKASTQ